MVESVWAEDGRNEGGREVKVSGVSPMLEGGGLKSTAGPNLRSHNDVILEGELRLGKIEFEELKKDWIVS